MSLLALLATGVAAATGAVGRWTAEAADRQLASHTEWLTLLHYEERRLGTGYRSYVDDPRFFLAAAGPHDPASELAATLESFFAEPASQCRFVARRRWLTGHLPGLAAALPVVDCPEYAEWRVLLDARQVVLVFAASYLNSPSSMYGHTFLRFDRSDSAYDAPFLAYALNFGANIPPDENGLLYAWRGLAGGYPGVFAAAPYFEKLREYSRLENRDLWEYRLNLAPGEIERLLEHVWELRDINFDYYFFDENCSLRLLELLDVARPGHELARQFPNYAIPVDTVRAVIDAGMVAGVDYRPASLTALEHELGQLTAGERQLAKQLAAGSAPGPDMVLSALPVERRRSVANAAYGYLRYQNVREVRDPETVRRAYELLRAVNELPASASAVPEPPRPTQPDHGHRTGLVAVAAGAEDHEVFGDFEWRLSYHDLLDAGAGYPEGASLNMGRVAFRHKEQGTFQLQRLDVLEITSLASRDQFFSPLSWRVNAGLDRQWVQEDDVLVAQANAGFGGAWSVGSGVTLFAMATGRLEQNHELERELDVAPGLSFGLIGHSRFGNTLASVDRYRFTDGVDRTAWSLAHNLPLARGLALRLGFDRRISDSDGFSEAGVALRYHF